MRIRNRDALRGGSSLFSFVFLFVLGLLSCASLPFPFHYYNPVPDSYSGQLLGPTPKDDLPLTVCAPDVNSQGRCVILLAEEFFKLKAEYLTTKQALIDCQKSR